MGSKAKAETYASKISVMCSHCEEGEIEIKATEGVGAAARAIDEWVERGRGTCWCVCVCTAKAERPNCQSIKII